MTNLAPAELARRITAILDGVQTGWLALGGTGSTVGAILSWLERSELNDSEVAGVLAELDRTGYLARFLNLVSHRDLRSYLRRKNVPWEFVLQNWKPSLNDSGNFFAGFLIGAGESVADTTQLVVSLLGSPFSEELARERDKFWESVRFLVSPDFTELLRKFAESPQIFTRLAFAHYQKEVEERLWNLEFFEAGRILGFACAAIFTIVGALKKLPGILRNLARIARTLSEFSVHQMQRLGVSMAQLRKYLTANRPVLITAEGFILAEIAGDEAALIDKSGTPLAKFSRSKALRHLSGSTTPARVALKGLASLSSSAVNWLAEKNLLELARLALKKPAIPHLQEVLDAINELHRCQNFELVAGNWLRGIRRTDRLGRNMEKGASFVMRFAHANFRNVTTIAIDFERKTFGAHARFTDIVVLGVKYELKSISELRKGVVKQIARDVIRTLDGELDGLKRIRLIIDTDTIQVTKAEFVKQLQTALGEHRLFKDYKLTEQIKAALEKVVEGWPPRGNWPSSPGPP